MKAAGAAIGVATLLLCAGASTAAAEGDLRYLKSAGSQQCAVTDGTPWIYLDTCTLSTGWRINLVPGAVGVLTVALVDSLGVTKGCLSSYYSETAGNGGVAAVEPCDSGQQNQRWWTEGSPRLYIRSMSTARYLGRSAVDGNVRLYDTPGQAKGGTIGAKWCLPGWYTPPTPSASSSNVG